MKANDALKVIEEVLSKITPDIFWRHEIRNQSLDWQIVLEGEYAHNFARRIISGSEVGTTVDEIIGDAKLAAYFVAGDIGRAMLVKDEDE